MIQTEDRARKIAQRVAINKAIVERSDAYLSRTKTVATEMVEADLNNAQIKGLQTLVYTTDKVSDVVDWIKIRVGRDDKRKPKWTKDNIGAKLLKVLHEDLKQDANTIVDELAENSDLPADAQRQIHLRLIREYLTHAAAHFEYEKALRDKS